MALLWLLKLNLKTNGFFFRRTYEVDLHSYILFLIYSLTYTYSVCSCFGPSAGPYARTILPAEWHPELSIVPPRLSVSHLELGVVLIEEPYFRIESHLSHRIHSLRSWLPVQILIGSIAALTVQHSQVLGHLGFLIRVKRHTRNHVFACVSMFQVGQRVRGSPMLGLRART